MEKMVLCTLNPDALSEIRRKVYASRKDTSLSPRTTVASDLIAHDKRVITEFLTEEFEEEVLALFNSRVSPEPWPDINSWEYPGLWQNGLSEQISLILDGSDSCFLFSKSGSHHLRISKISQH